MLTKLKARILSDLWAAKMSTVELDKALGKEEGFIGNFLIDEKKETLPPEMLKRIAETLKRPYRAYTTLSTTSYYDTDHVFAIKKAEELNRLTKWGRIKWIPIDRKFSLKAVPDTPNAVSVVMESYEKARRTINLDPQDSPCTEAGPTFCGLLGSSGWKVYLTCAYTRRYTRFCLSKNVYFVDERGHVIDYLEPFNPGEYIKMMYIEEELSRLYGILLKYFDRMLYLYGSDDEDEEDEENEYED